VSAVLEPIGIAGVLRSASAIDAPRPHVAVFGAVHGNEPCGLRAIERLRAEFARAELQLLAGTLDLIHGNPPATEQHERHTRGGVDLNRLFDYRFEAEVPAAHWARRNAGRSKRCD
jgi:succinylglutamate desuccinylase